jgi:hypothetical protein
MMKPIKSLGGLLLLAAILAMAGCGPGELKKEEVRTLEQNLNKPVDVEKIRAEYKAQQESGKAGAATDEGSGN